MNSSVISQLTQYLLQTAANYSINARPSFKIIILATLTLSKTMKLSSSGVLELIVGLTFNWNDTRLVWNPDNYDRISEINLPTNSVWTPTLALLNVANSDFYVNVTSTVKLVVTSGGQVYWTTGKKLVSSCRMDLFYFPFDSQTCNLTFTSTLIADANTSAEQYLVNPAYPSVLFSSSSAEEEFALLNASMQSTQLCSKRVCASSLVVTLDYKRLENPYMFNLIMPSFFLAFLVPFAYFIPSENNVKVTMTCTLITALYVLQQNIARMLPAGSGLTLCSVMLTIVIASGCFSVIGAVVTLRLRITAPAYLDGFVSSLRTWLRCAGKLKKASSTHATSLTSINGLQADIGSVDNSDGSLELETAFHSEKLRLLQSMIELMQVQTAARQSDAVTKEVASKKAKDWNVLDLCLNAILFTIVYGCLLAVFIRILLQYAGI